MERKEEPVSPSMQEILDEMNKSHTYGGIFPETWKLLNITMALPVGTATVIVPLVKMALPVGTATVIVPLVKMALPVGTATVIGPLVKMTLPVGTATVIVALVK